MENGALSITAVNLSDAGMYQCIAENKHGVLYSSAELLVLGKPPTPPQLFGSFNGLDSPASSM